MPVQLPTLPLFGRSTSRRRQFDGLQGRSAHRSAGPAAFHQRVDLGIREAGRPQHGPRVARRAPAHGPPRTLLGSR